MTGALRVEPEHGRRDRRAFVEVPYRLYRDEPRWVPPLRMAEKALMAKSHPFHAHATVRHFLARRGRRVVGRIAAIENRRHNEFHGDRVGFFGFFDVEPDPEAAEALVDAARAWTGARALSTLRGPVSYSTNETCGVLVEGFDEPPMVMMPWNRPDYDALLRAAGLVATKDLLAYWLPSDTVVPERFRRVISRRFERSAMRIRPIDLRRFDVEIQTLLEIYNASWERNWGFVPATREEFEQAARDMRPLLAAEISGVAEVDGRPVAFLIGVRDLNMLLRGTSGRLFPLGFLRILLRLSRVPRYRVVALGIVPEARGRAINEALFIRAMDAAAARGTQGGEAGWILEDNTRMRATLQALGARAWKRYRLYEDPAPARRGGAARA